MKSLLLQFAAGAFFVLCVPEALGEQYPVLKASKGTDSVLIVGSLHVGVVDGERATQALSLVRRSSALCFETDRNDAAGAAEDGKVIFLNAPGSDLRSRIGPAAYAATVAHLRAFLDDGNQIDALSPFAVSTILTMNLPQLKKDILAMAPRTSPDADLESGAKQLGKPVFAIERPGATRAAFAAISDADWSAYVSGMISILDCPSCAQQYSENMSKANRVQTDFESLHRQLHAAMASEPRMLALIERLHFGQRNRDMAESIARPPEQRRCDLVAVGIGHLGGPNGLVPLLRKAGWQVDQVAADGSTTIAQKQVKGAATRAALSNTDSGPVAAGARQ